MKLSRKVKSIFVVCLGVTILGITASNAFADPYSNLQSMYDWPTIGGFEFISCGAPSGDCLNLWGGNSVYTDTCQESSFPAYCQLYYSLPVNGGTGYCYLDLEYPSSHSYYPWIVDYEEGGNGCPNVGV